MLPMHYDSTTEQCDGLGISYQDRKSTHQSMKHGRDSSKNAADSKSYLGSWGRVYFIQSLIAGDQPGPIKIGWTNKGGMAKRIDSLQTACPYALKVRGDIEAPKLVERRIHNHFHAHRMRGEWFQPDPEILAFLDYVEAHGLPDWTTERPVLERKICGYASRLAELVKKCAEPCSPDESTKEQIERAAERIGIPYITTRRYWYGLGGPQVYKRTLPAIKRVLGEGGSNI